MVNIINEAIEIFNDLVNVIIIGAVAVMIHTKKTRTSFDVDVAVAGEITHDFLIDKGYIPVEGKRDSWSTPRGSKVDFFREDVSDIPIKKIIDTAVKLKVNSKNEVKVASIEVLIVAKFRAFNSVANRAQDMNDLQIIARKKFKEIDWKLVRQLSKSDLEYDEIRKAMTAFQNY